MPIRDAVPADTEQICSLIEEHARYEGNTSLVHDRAEMHRHLFGSDPKAWVLIAEVDGAAAGFALCWWTLSSWEGRPGIWMDELFIRPGQRGNGLGRAMMLQLRARTNGRIEWEMQEGNDRAAAFYRQLGAEEVRGWVRYRWQPEHAASR